ncbi:HAD family hydrolase [Aquirufa sp.]|jgi:HAD superfamily hydrolase (TIGR01549 family)|uniref:HAD family hydrolase n=1 Tax=Aquirufa sp. TaxID=2676249 RepID=UPI0037BF8624
MFNLLLDFDGTLFDTESGHEAAYLETFAHFNLGPCPSYESLKGIKTREVFDRYQSIHYNTDEMAQYKSSAYQAGLSAVKAFVDLNLLNQLRVKGVGLYIVTGGSRKSIEGLLNLHQAKDLFNGIVCAEDYYRSKPDPEPFLHCIRQYAVTGEIHGVEDSVQGIQSVRAARLRAIGVHNSEVEKLADAYYPSINTYLSELIER